MWKTFWNRWNAQNLYSVLKFVEHFQGRVDKMEYNLRLQKFCYSGNGKKLFERKENSSSYSIMNHLSLEKGLAAAQSHRKICSGHLHIGKDLTPSHVTGGFYSQYQFICSHWFNFEGSHIETNIFRNKPEPNKLQIQPHQTILCLWRLFRQSVCFNWWA